LPLCGSPVFLRSPRCPPMKTGRSSPRLPAPPGLPTPNLPAAPATSVRNALRAARPKSSAACLPRLPARCKQRTHSRCGRPGSPPEPSVALQRIRAGSARPASRRVTRTGAEAPDLADAPSRSPANRPPRSHGLTGVATPRRSPLMAFLRLQRAAAVSSTAQPHEETEPLLKHLSSRSGSVSPRKRSWASPPSGLCSAWRSGPVSAPHPPLPLSDAKDAASTPEACSLQAASSA
jgi:hypothetical protein